MSKKLTLEIKILVTYNVEPGEEKLLRENLAGMPTFAAGEGLFTGALNSTVDDWRSDITEVPMEYLED